jgi:hypothetical protein
LRVPSFGIQDFTADPVRAPLGERNESGLARAL